MVCIVLFGLANGAKVSLINGFQLLKFLGKGTFGAVYQARREADSKIYAIKKVDTRRMTAKERAEAVNEIRVLASVAGEHVITFYEAFVADDVLYIVTEYAGNGDLLGFLKNKKRAGHLPEATVWSFFIQMLLGTKTMHENNILHRDLKAANVFLCSNTFLKLGDLGVAKVLKHDQALASTQVGTPYYVAPEVWRNKPYNSKCDVWSLGCLLYELCTFRPPFEAESMEGLARKVMKGKYEQIPSFYSQALRTTLAKLLVIEPKQRASVEELLASDEIRSRLNSITDAVSAQSDHHTSEPVNIVSTIAVPRRFNDLTKNLPPSRYDTKDVSPKGIGPGEGAPPSARMPMTPQQQHAYGAQYPGQYPVAGAGAVPPSREIRMVYHAPNGNPNSSRASIFARGGYNPITHAQMHTGASQAYRLSNHYQQQQEYSAQRARVTPSHWY
ncbi:protein kinase domain containing protein [Chrysochromulina tobinii]|uniref:non-specific serine/threonine protein kinase n=1 Tax=Chrysochromulina tobinii TaxID=1460289 RepID=A0A0M0JWZ0_9EUKA|nr:protein kinase domain containing protein [Chrysochromulina tobinii]|eukprot:KOO30842.1 protein kinase domain containing protein [Chrysochromulina sp. CCMP291]